MIIHIDTDVCEDFGVNPFDANGAFVETTELVSLVCDHLIDKIGDDVWNRIKEQVVFAIAVDSVECWLLTLHAQQGRQSRDKNCIKFLADELRRKNKPAISRDNKPPAYYSELAKDFAKAKDLRQYRQHNDSLDIFLLNMEKWLDVSGYGTPDPAAPAA